MYNNKQILRTRGVTKVSSAEISKDVGTKVINQWRKLNCTYTIAEQHIRRHSVNIRRAHLE